MNLRFSISYSFGYVKLPGLIEKLLWLWIRSRNQWKMAVNVLSFIDNLASVT